MKQPTKEELEAKWLGKWVATYSSNGRGVHKVIGVHDGMLKIPIGKHGSEYWLHPKQCRLLKKKERRRVWVEINTGILPPRIWLADPMSPDAIPFIEVKRDRP